MLPLNAVQTSVDAAITHAPQSPTLWVPVGMYLPLALDTPARASPRMCGLQRATLAWVSRLRNTQPCLSSVLDTARLNSTLDYLIL